MAECVCLYAIVSGAERPLRARGMGGERLRRVTLAGVDAVIGVLPRAPRPQAAALRRYDRAIRGLMASHAAVLPARFGTCLPDADDLASRIEDRKPHLRRGLRLVRHRVQMTVRVFSSESVQSQFGVGSESVQSRTGVRPGSERGQTGVRAGSEHEYESTQDTKHRSTQGTEFLQQRARMRRIPGAEPLQEAVERWVKAERTERHEAGRLAGTLYHLIPRSAAGPYQQALERAARDSGVTTIVSGPWPPYAFADHW